MAEKKGIVSTQPGASGQSSTQPPAPAYRQDEEQHFSLEESSSPLAMCLGIVCCPITILASWFTLAEREEAIILQFGKYHKQVKEPGCSFSNCWGREIRTISTKKITIDLPLVKVADYNGNPLMVSAIVCYQYENPLKALLEVENHYAFIRQQAQTVMRQVVGQFPYETSDNSPSLRSDYAHVGDVMTSELNQLVARAGAVVFSFRLDEISYSPEIAAAMLKKQQAKSIIEARHIIVEGAVSIAHDAVSQLERTGMNFNDEQKATLVTNLLTVTCSDNDAQPTLPLSHK
eukprot:Nk52_evm2s377 gene=Nk52_evmTU2s377